MLDREQYQEKKSVKNNAGFYIALAICIVTIAAAAWTTYGSVADYNSRQEEESSSPASNVEVHHDVSGQKYEESSAGESSMEPSPEPSQVEESQTEESSEEPSSEPVQETVAEDHPSPPIEKGTIIKVFSPQNPLQSKTTSDWRTHHGVDIAASEGTPVHAMHNGTVQSVSSDPMLGNVICIEHTGGYTAYYCGLTETSVVKEGSAVASGDTIGYIGIVPSEMLDESHLHLEVTKDGAYIDPTKLF